LVRSSGLTDQAGFGTLANLDLKTQTSEMVGLQLYLNTKLTTQPGHLFFADSQYGLTAISQLEVWDEEFKAPLQARGVEAVLSIDITEWRRDPHERHPPAFTLPIDVRTSQELADLTVRQLGPYTLANGLPLLRPETVLGHHLDDDIDLATEVNRSELLVHPPGTWGRRPVATTSLQGLFLASDFARNPADLATMEGACSAGKLAATAILARHAPQASPPTVHDLVAELEPSWMKQQQRGFEALMLLVGGFDRAERLLDALLTAEDDVFESLRALRFDPSGVSKWLSAPQPGAKRPLLDLVTLPLRAASWLARKSGLFGAGKREVDVARLEKNLRKISQALQMWH
jgi:hypothetical protein